MPAAAEIVDRITRVLPVMVATGDVDAAWLVEVLRLWLASAAFDQAAGLASGWRAHVRHRRQVECLRRLLGGLPPMTARTAAGRLHHELLRYATTRWPADEASGRRPPDFRGDLYDYLTAGGPTSAERLRKLLAGSPLNQDLPQQAA
jgi:hypothetical protein